jgi:hypothetical protein
MQAAARWLVVGTCLAIGSTSSGADDRETALRVVERGIQAHGGADRLTRAQTITREANGVIYLANKPQAFSTTLTMAYPDRLHDVIKIDAGATKLTLVRVVNGDKGWSNSGGATADMPKEQVDELTEELYLHWLTTLVPLKDPEFALSPAGEVQVDGKPAVGVKVGHKGRGPVNLWFDRDSGFLVKAERTTRIANLDVAKRYQFSDFKEFSGVTFATKQTEFLQGKKTTELLIRTFEFPVSIGDSTFAKP